MSHHIRLFAAIALALGAAGSADAQTAAPAQKKIYCWDEGGRRVCGDALPASALDKARTEVSSRSGLAGNRIDRALTEQERQALAERQAVAAADAEVKGGGRDAEYAVERAVLRIVAARR